MLSASDRHDNPLHNLLHNLLNWHGDLDGADNLMEHLDSLKIRTV
jgi:hypothetical protein